MTNTDPIDPRSTLELLQALGYRVHRRQSGWVECLITYQHERWTGRGGDDDAAIADAIAAMFPSSASRRALEALVAARAKAPQQQTLPLEPSTAGAASPADVANAIEPPRPAPKPLPRIELPPKSAAPPPSRFAYVRPPATLASGEAIARLDDLDERMQTPLCEAPLWTSERQRMFFLAWLSRARQIQDDAGDARPVHDRVYETASQIQKLGKIWWPGSVAALRLEATPPQCVRDLSPAGATDERALGESLRTWSDVADAAERVFAEHERRDEEAACDEHGWADADMLAPPPHDAEDRLRELRSDLTALTGDVVIPKELLDANTLQPRMRFDAVVRRSKPIEPALWGTLAQTARWLRGATVQLDVWGAIMGRLRWSADHGGLPDACRARLLEYLDPRFAPPRPWAAMLSYDANKRERQQKRKEILRRAPQSSDTPASEAVVAWLRDAIASGFVETDELREQLAPFQDAVMSIDIATFSSERRARKQLRALHAALSGQPEVEEPEAADDVVDSSARRAAERSARAEHLLTLISPHTRGKRALVLGNRKDPEADTRIQEIFDFAHLDRLLVVPSQIESASQRIANKSYDFVLTATGFQSHSSDRKIKEACRDSGVRYVSVDRGRPQACILHLARELGIG